jgi:trimeric autotransporter adhesin
MRTTRHIAFASLCVALAFDAWPAVAQQIGPWRGANPVAGGYRHSLGLKTDGRIVAWGDNTYGQTDVPGTNTDFVAVASGAFHSLGLKSDGRIVAWGRNDSGQTNVPAPNAAFVGLAAGTVHSLGLKSDGSIVAWGDNTVGQTDVPSPDADFVAIAANGGHSLGVKLDGRIVAWGLNNYGQTTVPAPNADFVAVAAGAFCSLGLKSDGSIVAWGYNDYGQTNVPSPNANFVAMAEGYYHSLGLKSDGSIATWGWNHDGQTTVPAPNADFVAVATGESHSLGLKSDGRIVAWGLNYSGQTTVPAPNADFGQQSGVVPPGGPLDGGTVVTIMGSNLCNGTDVTNVTLCGVAATIVTQNAWRVVVETGPAAVPINGDMVIYSASYGSISRTNGFTYCPLPTVVTMGLTNITATNAVGTGEVLSDGGEPVTERGLCWGTATNPTVSDAFAKSGSGTGVFAEVALASLSPGTWYHVRAWARNIAGVGYGADIPYRTHYAVMASAGPYGAITPNGIVKVEDGSNITFTIMPNTGYQVADVLVDGSSVGATNRCIFENVTSNHTIIASFCGIGPWRGANPVAAGYYHSLVLKSDGRIVAWGLNSDGQTTVPAPNADFVAVAAGEQHSLGLKSNGRIIAWGWNGDGEANVPVPNADFVAVAAGYQLSLGLKSDGRIAAWGLNAFGMTNVPVPNADFVAMAAGYWHSLGLKSDGHIVAWGDNIYGQTTVPTPNADFVAVAAGYQHSLGLKSDGSIVAWGRNNYGQTNVPAPNADFVAVVAGVFHSLGLKSDGHIVAWGDNSYGLTDVPAPNADFVAVSAGMYHSLGLKSDGRIVTWGWNAFGYGLTNVPAPNADFGQQSGIVPPRGPMAGGTTVIILGFNLGNGTDVTNVTLCGVAATIVTQSSCRVIVQTVPAAAPTNGDVGVYSTGYGSISRTNAFTYFTETYTTNGTPQTWLDQYGLTNDLSDTDGDGMPAWAEYRAGTDPTDPASRLALNIGQMASNLLLSWSNTGNRTYRLWFRHDLLTGSWQSIGVYTNLASGTTWYTNDLSTNAAFFRITVVNTNL